jgi:tetratricopeptide (TPR) repeat protein
MQNSLLHEMPASLPALNERAENLLHQGELSLLKGDASKAAILFDEVTKLEPSKADLFFRQGLAYFEYGSGEGREKALLIACKKFKAAVALSPEQIEAWHAWGNALFLLGMTYHEHHYFQDAEEKYRTALKKLQTQNYDAASDLHWDYGSVWNQIASHSGEACDFQTAIDAFETAASKQSSLPSDFWIDYGTSCINLSQRVGDIRLLVKAINCFKHAVSLGVNFASGWINLAGALQHLYEKTHDEDHFTQANECFASAAQLSPHDTGLWLRWAGFLLDAGRANQDVKRLRSSIEKCHRAYACNPDSARACAIWAEALALLGELLDRLDLLYEAQNKIASAESLSKESVEVCYHHGLLMNCFGRYFNDYDYHYQAIEKFQQGLSIDRTCAKLWYAIAKSYSILGDLENDLEAWEKALRFYTKTLDLDPSSYVIFDYALTLADYGEASRDIKWIEESAQQFERALNIQKNALYIHPDWLFHYACTLDLLGGYLDEETYYTRAIEIFSHVLMIDPEYPGIHHQLGLAFFHLGDLMGDVDHFYRATHHFRLAAKHDEENDQILLDLGLAFVNIAQRTQDAHEADGLFRDAEHKMTQAAKLGNLQAYYNLACLYSLLGQHEKAMRFIHKADEFESLPALDELMSDDWLDNLRTTPDFRAFLLQLEKPKG